jgi:hypothetical protein
MPRATSRMISGRRRLLKIRLKPDSTTVAASDFATVVASDFSRT